MMKLIPRPWTWDNKSPEPRWLEAAPPGVPVVWQAELPTGPSVHSYLKSILSPDEQDRLLRLRIADDRQRFLVGRGLLRLLAGAELGLPPQQVAIAYNPFGKPRISPAADGRTVRFNVSHSGRLVLLAFDAQREVGVDVEQLRPGRNLKAVAERVFSHTEFQRLLLLAPGEWPAAFFQHWTRHESVLKARGTGFGGEGGCGTSHDVVRHDLELPAGYAGAVACLKAGLS